MPKTKTTTTTTKPEPDEATSSGSPPGGSDAPPEDLTDELERLSLPAGDEPELGGQEEELGGPELGRVTPDELLEAELVPLWHTLTTVLTIIYGPELEHSSRELERLARASIPVVRKHDPAWLRELAPYLGLAGTVAVVTGPKLAAARARAQEEELEEELAADEEEGSSSWGDRDRRPPRPNPNGPRPAPDPGME